MRGGISRSSRRCVGGRRAPGTLGGVGSAPCQRQAFMRAGLVVLRVEKEERRRDPPAHVPAVGQIELGEDRVHVLLDRAFGQDQRLGDRGIALAGRDSRENLELARGQPGQARMACPRAGLDEHVDDERIDHGASLGHLLDRSDQLLPVADPFLEQVGAPAGAAVKQPQRVCRLGVLVATRRWPFAARCRQSRPRSTPQPASCSGSRSGTHGSDRSPRPRAPGSAAGRHHHFPASLDELLLKSGVRASSSIGKALTAWPRLRPRGSRPRWQPLAAL